MNPLAPRVIELLGLGEEELDFTRFIHLLSLFHQRASRADKLRRTLFSSLPSPLLSLVAFRMYNLSGDGFIKREELAQVLGMMAGHEIADDELASIIDHILLELDLNGDERIDFDEFSLVPGPVDTMHLFAIPRSCPSLTAWTVSPFLFDPAPAPSTR